MLKSHKELDVWQKAFELCKDIYRLSSRFPADERFGLIAQTRRCAVSVPSNIAEGYNRGATRDYIRFLWISNGSLAELDTQLLLASELGYAPSAECEPVFDNIARIERMLRAMIRSLEAKSTKSPSASSPIPRSPIPKTSQATSTP
ncbi:MAG: four helix bundle protein [Phycisphaerales bacterium]|nr:four helix bundle protein [Phycisphaerales bacterium]